LRLGHRLVSLRRLLLGLLLPILLLLSVVHVILVLLFISLFFLCCQEVLERLQVEVGRLNGFGVDGGHESDSFKCTSNSLGLAHLVAIWSGGTFASFLTTFCIACVPLNGRAWLRVLDTRHLWNARRLPWQLLSPVHGCLNWGWRASISGHHWIVHSLVEVGVHLLLLVLLETVGYFIESLWLTRNVALNALVRLSLCKPIRLSILSRSEPRRVRNTSEDWGLVLAWLLNSPWSSMAGIYHLRLDGSIKVLRVKEVRLRPVWALASTCRCHVLSMVIRKETYPSSKSHIIPTLIIIFIGRFRRMLDRSLLIQLGHHHHLLWWLGHVGKLVVVISQDLVCPASNLLLSCHGCKPRAHVRLSSFNWGFVRKWTHLPVGGAHTFV